MNDKNRDDIADVAATEGADGVVGAAVGGTGGALLGTVMGGVLGGPVGAVVGVGVGTLAGAALGYAVDYDSHEPEFRTNHAPDPARARPPWARAAPAYRYGWEAHDRPEFHDKTYDHIRTELHKGWTGSGDFNDYEPYIQHAWRRRAESRQSGSFSEAAKA
jgi:phage tail tape-measure protein